jgi:hypothetical protein
LNGFAKYQLHCYSQAGFVGLYLWALVFNKNCLLNSIISNIGQLISSCALDPSAICYMTLFASSVPSCECKGQDLLGAVVLHQPLDRVVLKQDPGLLGLRLPESMDAADCLEHAVGVLAALQQHKAVALCMYVET